jgi:hypothetical protein
MDRGRLRSVVLTEFWTPTPSIHMRLVGIPEPRSWMPLRPGSLSGKQLQGLAGVDYRSSATNIFPDLTNNAGRWLYGSISEKS